MTMAATRQSCSAEERFAAPNSYRPGFTGKPGFMRALELWGGHEQTVNRVGRTYHDQTIRSGHERRIDDLDRFAALGLKALRYPVLWEGMPPPARSTRTSPAGPPATPAPWPNAPPGSRTGPRSTSR